ncbi:MAG: hypothetical protein K0Q70_798 [Rhodospirillales bacterium]|jgi:hypothetical protein|nr:hypothetical protein [Rhodospirillales bacterium]
MINLFMHIPKTAGTTLRSIVDAQYGSKRVLTYYNQTSSALLDNLAPYLATKPFEAMIGHFPFGVHRAAPNGYRYYTFLREPEPLVMSTYDELIKAAGPTSVPEIAAEQLSFDQALDKYGAFFDNLQLRYVLGLNPGTLLPNDAFDQACARLESEFALVGIVEQFDEALLVISKLLGWRPCIYRRMNVGSGKPLDDALRERLSALTDIDRRLYQWAAQRFADRISGESPEFYAALDELRQALAKADDGKRTHYQPARIASDDLPLVGRYLSGS